MSAPIPPIGDLPIPAGCRSVLIYGGAFDPPHRAHLTLGPVVRAQLGCDLLLYMPASAAPLKDGPSASDTDRVNMLAAGLAGVPNADIATLELARGGTSYTIDTVGEIHRRRPGVTLRLLIGADQAVQFHRWKGARELLTLAEPAVMLRPPYSEPAALLDAIAPHWDQADLPGWEARCVRVPPMGVSSTLVRELLARDPRDPALAALVPAPVLAYIRQRGLYAREG